MSGSWDRKAAAFRYQDAHPALRVLEFLGYHAYWVSLLGICAIGYLVYTASDPPPRFQATARLMRMIVVEEQARLADGCPVTLSERWLGMSGTAARQVESGYGTTTVTRRGCSGFAVHADGLDSIGCAVLAMTEPPAGIRSIRVDSTRTDRDEGTFDERTAWTLCEKHGIHSLDWLSDGFGHP